MKKQTIPTQLNRIHHLTAIAGNAAENLGFYRDILGLRLVKKTVNFDDPSAYHLYFGDRVGTPGSLLTFFPWEDLPRGRPGAGLITAIAFRVPEGSLEYWEDRLHGHGVTVTHLPERFGEKGLQFPDPDGLVLELLETSDVEGTQSWLDGSQEDVSGAIAGFHSATAMVWELEPSLGFLEAELGLKPEAQEGNRYRFRFSESGPGLYYDLEVQPDAPRGRPGAGTVHHIAFSVKGSEEQEVLHQSLEDHKVGVSPIIDRTYFHSIYFREPATILYEVATDGPGFLIDESESELGETLQLPPHYESRRAAIEAALPALERRES